MCAFVICRAYSEFRNAVKCVRMTLGVLFKAVDISIRTSAIVINRVFASEGICVTRELERTRKLGRHRASNHGVSTLLYYSGLHPTRVIESKLDYGRFAIPRHSRAIHGQADPSLHLSFVVCVDSQAEQFFDGIKERESPQISQAVSVGIELHRINGERIANNVESSFWRATNLRESGTNRESRNRA